MRLFLGSVFTLLAACSGGGDSSPSVSHPPGRVQVVIDTATGSDALVQFQVVAATLVTDTGAMTGNLLAAPRMLTLADPMAQADGVVLHDVPTGSYTTLRLGLAPGSGVALYATATVPVSTAVELVVPFDEPLVHDASRQSWIVCGHFGLPPTSGAVAGYSWAPMLRGMGSEAQIALAGLDVALIEASGLTATDPRLEDAPLMLAFDTNCEFLDDDGNAYAGVREFLGASGRGDDLQIEGRLHRNGRFDSDRIRRRHGNHLPRLIGRVTELVPGAEQFYMDVLAEARRGSHSLLATPERALVDASSARIERSGTRQPLPFSVIAVGNLVKVEWLRRLPVGNGVEKIMAREIQVSPAGGVAMHPEWQGRVDGVDLQNRTITIVPRNNDPIIVRGQPLHSVTLNVDQGVPIQRRARHGSWRGPIELDEIVPGHDRIWWRGTVSGPATIDATWVRVRDDR